MLTLKVITTDLNGQTETHLFSGDTITHKEYHNTDHGVVSKVQKNNPTAWIIGRMEESSSTQRFRVSDVAIYDDDRSLKNQLFIVPQADCYIMDNGRTIDSFSCFFEEETGSTGDKQ